jgi:hypothetical protein
MSSQVRARLFVTQMRRGRLHARSCRHVRVDGPYRPSGRNASPSGITPPTIMSPTQGSPGSRTEIRLSARAHTTSPNDRAHAPPTPATVERFRPLQPRWTCVGMHAQIRSVASPRLRCVRRRSAPSAITNEGMVQMIVIGVDTHKRSHTLVALDAATGATRGQLTIPASDEGTLDALRFAGELDIERVWAIEDCRHVSGRLERGLVASGDRVIRVAPGLTDTSRRSVREPGKSDPIDATAIARAALREGIDRLPVAFLDEQAHEIRVLNDYRDQLVNERVRLASRLRWHLVQIAPRSGPRCPSPPTQHGSADRHADTKAPPERGFAIWARLVSNQRPLACEATVAWRWKVAVWR